MGHAQLKIGELALACGVSDQAVRLYERMGLLTPVGKTTKGYRLYDAASVETLRFIKQAQRSGFILEEIKVLLHTDIRNEQACASMRELLDRKIHVLTERLVELQGVKNVLQSLRQACDGEPGPMCPAFLKLCVPHCAVPDPKGVRPVSTLHNGLHRRFDLVQKTKAEKDKDSDSGRRFVAAYVDYIHYVVNVHELGTGQPESEKQAKPKHTCGSGD